MSNTESAFNKALNAYEAMLTDQKGRTGITAARVASSLANNVDPDVLALQMTKYCAKNNPKDNIIFSAADVLSITKFYNANQTRPVLTKSQAKALIATQKDADGVPSVSRA